VTPANSIRHRPAALTALRGGTAPEPGGYPVVIWLLLGGNFVVRAAGFAYPFMAYHVAGQGHGAEAVGLVLAAFGVGWVVGQLVCGWSVDRIGGRSTLAVAMLSAAVMLAVMASVHSVVALAVGAVLAGLVYDAPRPVLGAAIGDLLPDPERRAKVDAWRFGWVANLGAAVTGGAGGLLADRIGIPWLYLIDAAACAAFAVVAVCCLPSDRGTRSAAAKTSYRQAFSDRRLVVLLVSSVATLTAFMALFAAMPMLMSARGLSAGAYGMTQLANAVAVVALTPLITFWLSKRVAVRPRLDILAAAAVWTTACMAAAAFAHTTIHFSLAAATCAPGEIAWFVVVAGIVHRIAPADQRGRYHGIWGSALAASAVFAPILGAVSLDRGGPMLVAAATFTVGLIGAALCWPLARTLADSTSIATVLTTDRELTK
jgi:MFS family permease